MPELLVQATGGVALGLSYLGLLLGLVVGTRAPWGVTRRRKPLLAVHRWLSLGSLAAIVAHLVVFAAFLAGGSWLVALVPQTAPVAGLGYSAGVVAFYLALLVGPTYYLRDRLGRRTWLLVHQFAALVYALALWHTLALGSSVRVESGWRVTLWVAQVPLLALFALRLARPVRASDVLDLARRGGRFESGFPALLRGAVVIGICLAGFVVLYVALAAAGPV